MIHMTGDQSLLKRLNRAALVRLIKAQPGLSRVDLAKRTGLTKTTVGALVQELIEEGWLRQSVPLVSRGVGRRPSPLSLDSARIGLLGAEVAVDYLNVIACNLQGNILFSHALPYKHESVARSVNRLCKLISEARAVLDRQRRRALGVGVGVAGMFDAATDVLRFAPNIGWHDVPIGELVAARLARIGYGDLEVITLNDANAAALSEYVFGAPHEEVPLVYLAMGIGLGAGVVLSDRLYLGHDGLAGEIGHTILQRGGPPCACGRHGCAETFISQRAVSREATGRESPTLSIEALVARIAHRDRATIRAAKRAGEYLGLLIQNLGNTINPGVVVLGGPLCQLGDVFIRTAFKSMRDHAGRHDYHRHSVRLCRFGINACAVGAAASVLQPFLHSLDAQPSHKKPTRRSRRHELHSARQSRRVRPAGKRASPHS
jgi:predicted NBD/HSP70 family sugar kinase